MKKIGFWKTRGVHSEGCNFPDPCKLVGHHYTPKEKQMLIAYLKGGKVDNSYFGFSRCRCCEKDGPDMGASDLTDGIYLWPEGLYHYIEEHDVKLPDDFLSHVLVQTEALRL